MPPEQRASRVSRPLRRHPRPTARKAEAAANLCGASQPRKDKAACMRVRGECSRINAVTLGRPLGRRVGDKRASLFGLNFMIRVYSQITCMIKKTPNWNRLHGSLGTRNCQAEGRRCGGVARLAPSAGKDPVPSGLPAGSLAWALCRPPRQARRTAGHGARQLGAGGTWPVPAGLLGGPGPLRGSDPVATGTPGWGPLTSALGRGCRLDRKSGVGGLVAGNPAPLTSARRRSGLTVSWPKIPHGPRRLPQREGDPLQPTARTSCVPCPSQYKKGAR